MLIDNKIFIWIPYFPFVLHKKSILMDNIWMYHIDLSDNFISNKIIINPLKPELNPICYLLALLGAHHFLDVTRIRVKLLTLGY